MERIVEAGVGISGQMAQGLLKSGSCFYLFPFLLCLWLLEEPSTDRIYVSMSCTCLGS